MSQMAKWLLLASPFLALRTAYGIIGVFEATGAKLFTSMWSSLFGSATAFALMALLPEYVVVCTHIYILHSRVRTCSKTNQFLDRDYNDITEGGRELDSRR
jgi:hypothetical protein